MRILLGYDHSACSDEAIDGLEHSGLPPGNVEALVFAVADMWPIVADLDDQPLGVVRTESGEIRHEGQTPVTVTGGPLPSAVRRARAYALERLEEVRAETEPALERLRRMFPGWRVASEAVAGSPYNALLDRAKNWGADLIVVGSHGRTPARRLFLGSISLNVALHAPCSVRISRSGAGPAQGAARLVLGFDGSPDSEAALQTLLSRVWPAGSSVRVLSVVEPEALTYLPGPFPPLGLPPFSPPILSPAPPEEHDTNYHSWLEEACRTAAQRLQDAGLQADMELLSGEPKHVLVEEAGKWGADCLFVGARGQRGRTRPDLGTVATAVATRAHCSVEIIRRRPLSL